MKEAFSRREKIGEWVGGFKAGLFLYKGVIVAVIVCVCQSACSACMCLRLRLCVTSKMRSALGGMTPPAPAAPYAAEEDVR